MLSILTVLIFAVVNLTSAVCGDELFVEESSLFSDEESISVWEDQSFSAWDDFELSDSDSEIIFEDSQDNVDGASEDPYYEGSDTALQLDEYEAYETVEEPHDEVVADEAPEAVSEDIASDDAGYTIEDTITETFVFEQYTSADAFD